MPKQGSQAGRDRDLELPFSDEASRRLKAAVALFGSQEEAAEAAGITRVSLAKIVNGKSRPRMKNLLAICRAIGADPAQILGDELPRDWSATINQLPMSETVSIPMDDVFASAGPGVLALEEGKTSDFIGFPKHWLKQWFGSYDQLRLIGIRGDSMEPTLSDGDLAMIDLARREPSDGVFALVMDGMLLVKRLAPSGSGIVRVISDNKLTGVQRDIDVEAEADSFRVVGRVVWAGGKL